MSIEDISQPGQPRSLTTAFADHPLIAKDCSVYFRTGKTCNTESSLDAYMILLRCDSSTEVNLLNKMPVMFENNG